MNLRKLILKIVCAINLMIQLTLETLILVVFN